MSLRILTKYRCSWLSIMFARCLSSFYRSLNQTCSRKKYNLLTNSSLVRNNRYVLLNTLQEIGSIISSSLFLSYISYQLFGTFIPIVFVILGVLFTLYDLQDALLYQPSEPDTSRLIVQTPDCFHMLYETIIIETCDHEKLHGYLIKQTCHANECATLVFFHGNAGNIGHRLHNAHLLYRTCNINILLFDYRGYGKSTGKPSEEGLNNDAEAVYNYVRKRTDLNQEKIFLFGRSLGGAVALNLASRLVEANEDFPLYCIIVENTFTSIPDMAKQLFTILPVKYVPNWCYKNLFLSMKIIRHIKVPVLFISGGQDELVPPHMMRKLYEECTSSKKQLVVVADGQHNTTWLSYNYTSHVQKFLHECSTITETTSMTSSTSVSNVSSQC